MTANPIDFEQAQTLEDLAVLVRAGLKAHGVLVTHLIEDHHVVLAHAGSVLPVQFATAIPLQYAICQHTMAMDFPLAIDDTITHALLKDHLAFRELWIGAYLGAPVHGVNGTAVGAISAVEFTQRRWEAEDIARISRAAKVADRLISNAL